MTEQRTRWKQYDFKILQKGDRFEYYVAIIGQSNYEGAYAEYQIAPPVLNLLTPGKERIPTNASDATVFPLTLKRQEEPDYDENTVLQETQDGEWVVRFNKVPEVQYMKAVAEVQEDSMIGLSFFNPPGIKSSKNQPGGVSTSFFFVSGFYLPVHTHFHYVDDLSYRRVLNLSVDAPPAERSAGDGKDSNRFHVQLKVADLREEVKTSSYTWAMT